MDQEGRGRGSWMEPAKSEIKFSEVRAPGGLRLRETGFLFQGLQDWEGVGETLTTGVRWLSTVDTLLIEAFPVF